MLSWADACFGMFTLLVLAALAVLWMFVRWMRELDRDFREE